MSEPDQRRSTILLVEDEPGIAKLMKMFLEEAGYAVVLAANGRQGLARLDDARVDLIVSDYMMPEMNGAQFCRAARARMAATGRRIPIIMMSALLPPGVPVDEFADAFLEKTGTLKRMLATVEALLADAP